jgi:SAM-dependent methyltransferase
VNEALESYLRAAAQGADHLGAVRAAAERMAKNPWDVVHTAGQLARAQRRVAKRDLGLTTHLTVVEPDARTAVVRIGKGQPYPELDGDGRRGRGAFDTPMDLARRVVRAAMRVAEGPVRTGLDPACGTGAFLLAMTEAGLPEVYGTDLDEVALEVARIAVPKARLSCEDALRHGPHVDLVCGNPPFVPPERQDKKLRAELRHRFPWLRGRFDLVVPFAATAVDRVRPGGAAGLVLPFPALVQPYGSVLRRRWVGRHRVGTLVGPMPFPGAAVEIGVIVLQADRGPAELPSGVPPEELLRLETVPLDPTLVPGDVDLVDQVRARSVPLGSLAWIDTGLVAHGPLGGKSALIHDAPGVGRVPYADAREFFSGQRRWLEYRPEAMHRAKSPALFEGPKLVIQRLRGRGPVRVAVDRSGTYVGHTCTVVVPRDRRVDLDKLCALLGSPLVDGLVRIERGQRLDLYPRDVAGIPIPVAWLEDPSMPVDLAYGLRPDQVQRLFAVAPR